MKPILLLTTLLVAIISGLMFSYACSVNPGLRKLPDAEYIHAMQQINRAILNPLFLICFVGPLLLYALSIWITYHTQGRGVLFLLICFSGALYFFGVFLVTVMKNVPLNEMLDKITLQDISKDGIHNYRDVFEGPWNQFHMIRTVASVASLVLMLLALLRIR